MSATPPNAQTDTPTIATLMARGELFAAECPSREVLRHVTR
ncbi:hypothetical protein [Hydrogenophaga sp.]